jgi:hypothetical protein
MRYFWRFMLLALGFALTTAGLMSWHTLDFSFAGIWSGIWALSLHPVHVLVVGLAMIPPSLWEIFVLESSQSDA